MEALDASPHGQYRFDGTHEYFCGHRIIQKSEQIEYLRRAAHTSVPDTKIADQHKLNYSKYELNGELVRGAKTALINTKPEGYCKNPRHGGRHSISPYTSYSCEDCVASILVDTRATSPGIKLELHIIAPPADTDRDKTRDIANVDPITVRFNKGTCEIKTGTNTMTVQTFELLTGDDAKPRIVIPACYNRRAGVYYYGTTIVTLLGIPICETILYGGKCLSLSNENSSNDFIVNSVPVGYPAWVELQKDTVRSGHKNYTGQIWVHLKCKECHDRFSHTSAVMSLSSTPKITPKTTPKITPKITPKPMLDSETTIEEMMAERDIRIAAQDSMIKDLLEKIHNQNATIVELSIQLKEIKEKQAKQ
jgi:hypothetical protein